MLAASTTETPRPLPPAKARRTLQKTSSTPPPAYGSPFSFPSRGNSRQDILGSPMVNTFQMVGWGADHPQPQEASDLPEDLEWMNEKSREELKDLLLKADGILKERENELGLTSAICKSLYDDNIALKTKHRSFLTRQPSSPPRSTSSPEHLSRLSLHDHDASLSYSSSDSALGLINTPQPDFYRPHVNRISMSSSDVSYLEEQNAELLNKLERLEAEATSADHAGRRELKRLEKEIAFLREALEKTQAKSEELEEKVQGAVVSEAWRRKQEREIKVRAMRDLRRNAIQDRGAVKSFAPEGSKFGGPNDTFSFFPSAESPDPNRQLSASESSEMDLKLLASLPIPEHSLISQLLVKVQELEATNTKILKQQSETAEQLSAVQRETVNITKAYESLADTDTQAESNHAKGKEPLAANTFRFPTLDTELAKHNAPRTSNQDSALGLLDQEGVANSSTVDDGHAGLSTMSFWSEGCDGSWSSMSSQLALTAAPLSPIHFFSPTAQLPEVDIGPTLQSELERQLGNDRWDSLVARNHLRNTSLYDFSQLSVPPSPTPASRIASRRPSDELNYETMQSRLTPMPQKVAPVTLSVEPPTPVKPTQLEASNRRASSSTLCSPKLPRHRLLSDTARNRTTRWVDRKYKHRRNHSLKSSSSTTHVRKLRSANKTEGPRQRKTSLAAGIHQRLSSAVEGMLEKFTFEVTKPDNDEGSELGSESPRSSAYTDPEGTSQPGSPKDLSRETALQLHIAADKTPQKVDQRTDSLLLKLWLWLQFIVVILFFLYAMAKRGPADVLSDKNKKAVVRK
ncbi:hypothetical protein CVT24_005784 [Panaeolus cyanescens]|uniref:Uncharacterized protein n=1 Tax=Panaeolus cyanescens TaxID=181874 RepID=A0A409VCW7_9AGAR|nr:hypothetical protein CVT24_005784 [Panaeolus cyanescens]